MTSPPCWKCALMRCPMMMLVIVIPLFCLCDLYGLVLFLAVSWMVGMCLFLITPRNRFILKEDGKTLYFFCYDTYNKWKICSAEQNRSAILRVFIKAGGKLKQACETVNIGGFDDSLLSIGFFLTKSPYSEWRLWGNGYDKHGKPMFLGRKMADYVFVSTRKREPAYFIHGKTVITAQFDGIQKLGQVFYDVQRAIYREFGESQDCTTPAEAAKTQNGCFIILENENLFRLYKVLNAPNAPSVYSVYVPCFSTSDCKKGGQYVYKLHDGFSYIKSKA